jgi:hypothetical protein
MKNENEKINKELNDHLNTIKKGLNNIVLKDNNLNLICQSEDFNDLSPSDLREKFFSEPNLKCLENYKNIQMDLIMSEFKCQLRLLDSRGNKLYNWGINQTRGGFKYDPPLGWLGVGLRVLDKFDNGDNTWIGNSNSEGEWAISYYGFRVERREEVRRIVSDIVRGGSLRQGENQMHENCNDIYHPGTKVGKGIYFINSIEAAKEYAGIVEINKKKIYGSFDGKN